MLLGLAATGCGDGSSTGSGGSGAGGGGSGGEGGEGGAGGSTCKATAEICDRIDNDCDGQIDEVPGGCACNDGATQPCYTGPEGTAGVGPCKEGKQACEGGQWGACAGEVVPATEACNTVDDDCNGTADDMGVASCGIGACATSVPKCVSGQMQTCVPGQPGVEVCDGVDNNCNQLTDESDPMEDTPCESAQPGVCSLGTLSCLAQALVCVPDAMPSMETCDGLDNDCNGLTDDGLPGTGGACVTGAVGVCTPGTITCKQAAGAWQIGCFSDVDPSDEMCDGLDNDCDGASDEDNPEGGGACDTGQIGVCQAGTLECIGGALQCTQNVQAGAEMCNGLDDNCDGQIDEGSPGSGQPCGCAGSGITSCENGQLLCNGGPLTYFSEDFSDNSAGWTLGPQWAIGPASASSGCDSCPGEDPATDHSITADNGVAGQMIGGCTTTALHADYCIQSPVIDLSAVAGDVYLSFWRHLHSDYPSFVTNRVQAFNGSAWVNLWVQPDDGNCINDAQWTNVAGETQFNVTAHKNAGFRVRWCSNIGDSGAYAGGGWNIDDVVVASEVCQ